MVILTGSLRCGLLSIYSYIRKYYKNLGNEIFILPYLMFEPQNYIDYIKSSNKIFIILRNPADRAFSLWKSNLQNGLEWLDFENAIAKEQIRFYNLANKQIKWRYLYFRGGIYSQKIKNLRTLIGDDEFSNKLKILPFDEIMSGNILKAILNIERLPSKIIPQLNKSKIPMNPKIQFTARRVFEIFSEGKTKDIRIKNLVNAAVCKIIMNLNIRVQEITNMNKLDKSADTKGVYDFLKCAYKEEIRLLSGNLPQFQTWLNS